MVERILGATPFDTFEKRAPTMCGRKEIRDKVAMVQTVQTSGGLAPEHDTYHVIKFDFIQGSRGAFTC